MSDWKNPGHKGEPRRADPAPAAGAGGGTHPHKSSGFSIVPGGASGFKNSILVPGVKDALMLVGWIAGLILIAGLCWFLTQSVRSRFLGNAVNRVLEESGDSRRLGEPVSPGMYDSFGMGAWYTVTGESSRPAGNSGGNFSDRAMIFIFTFIGEGTFFPCAAVVKPGAGVQEFIPLNSHGVKMMKLISPGTLKIYAQRIEGDKL